MPKILAVLLATVLIAACSKRTAVPPPAVTFNTTPGQEHRITLSIPEELGAIGFVRSYATYAMVNERTCSPKDYSVAVGGRFNHPTQAVPFPVTREKRTFFVAVPHNPFVDEDYYGLGQCNWGISTVNFVVDLPDRKKMHAYVPWHHVSQKNGTSLLCYSSTHSDLARCFERTRVPSDRMGDFAPASVDIN